MKRSRFGGSLGTSALAVSAVFALSPALGDDGASDPYATYPASITVSGMCRDFHASGVSGGHPDMELNPPHGFGLYCAMVGDGLDSDGKPVFASTGYKTTTQATDSHGCPIIPARGYIAARPGDVAATMATTQGGVLTCSSRFAQWFRDTPGVNTSRTLNVMLLRQAGTNKYVFDGELDRTGAPGSGGFTVNPNQGSGDHSSPQNYDFTYECDMTFTYRASGGQRLTFAGDDDLWVYVDGKLVIDLGGIHETTWQSIDLDRLAWLADTHDYSIKIFYAERHRTESHFHIETNVQMRSVTAPPSTALAD